MCSTTIRSRIFVLPSFITTLVMNYLFTGKFKRTK